MKKLLMVFIGLIFFSLGRESYTAPMSVRCWNRIEERSDKSKESLGIEAYGELNGRRMYYKWISAKDRMVVEVYGIEGREKVSHRVEGDEVRMRFRNERRETLEVSAREIEGRIVINKMSENRDAYEKVERFLMRSTTVNLRMLSNSSLYEFSAPSKGYRRVRDPYIA